MIQWYWWDNDKSTNLPQVEWGQGRREAQYISLHARIPALQQYSNILELINLTTLNIFWRLVIFILLVHSNWNPPYLSILLIWSQWVFLHCLNLGMYAYSQTYGFRWHQRYSYGSNQTTGVLNWTCDIDADCKTSLPISDQWSEAAPWTGFVFVIDFLKFFPPDNGHLSGHPGICTCSHPWIGIAWTGIAWILYLSLFVSHSGYMASQAPPLPTTNHDDQHRSQNINTCHMGCATQHIPPLSSVLIQCTPLKCSPTHSLASNYRFHFKCLHLCVLSLNVHAAMEGEPLPAHATIETRHHTLAKLAPSPVVARLAPALQEVINSWPGTCMCPSGCTAHHVDKGASRFLPHSFGPGSLQDSRTHLGAEGLTVCLLWATLA